MQRKMMQIGLVSILGVGLASAVLVADSRNSKKKGADGIQMPKNDDFRSSHQRRSMQGSPPGGCPADFNDDGQVNGADLALLLGAWSTTDCTFNLTGGSCFVDGADLTVFLGDWGPCN